MKNISNRKVKRYKGLPQLALVFYELKKYTSEEFSSADLLSTAQKLIDLANRKQKHPKHSDYKGRPYYYTYDVADAFDKHQWRIVTNEYRTMMHDDYFDSCSAGYLERFRGLNLGINQ